jgi:Zn-dependent protease
VDMLKNLINFCGEKIHWFLTDGGWRIILLFAFIAIVFAIVAKVLLMTLGYEFFSGSVGNIIWMMIMYIIQINLVLMIFNLIPCPPLDGFSVISEIFNIKHTELYWTLVRYSDFIFIGLIVFGITGMIISPCVSFLFGLLQNFIIF